MVVLTFLVLPLLSLPAAFIYILQGSIHTNLDDPPIQAAFFLVKHILSLAAVFLISLFLNWQWTRYIEKVGGGG